MRSNNNKGNNNCTKFRLWHLKGIRSTESNLNLDFNGKDDA